MLTENNKLELVSKEETDKSIKEQETLVEKTNIDVPEQNIDMDINLSAVRKKRIRIDGDPNRILELDTSDLTVINRLSELYPKLNQLADEAANTQFDLKELSEEEQIDEFAKILKDIDTRMRNILDEIFDSDVSSKCAPSGSLFDPFNGEFRFEHIIDVLGNLYGSNLNKEFKKVAARMKKHTAKYTKGK